VRSSAEPPDERLDAEVESLRRTVARLAALERRLRTELEVERGAHEADVSRLEAEIDTQGARLAAATRQVGELRDRLAALRGKRTRSLRRRLARLRGRRAARSARAGLRDDRAGR
jgi:septal ring factor EnvC (AmiA/AmiB activator)